MKRTGNRNLGASALVGAAVAGGTAGGALLGIAESAWLALHTSTPTGLDVPGYGLALYGSAGLAAGLGLGCFMAAVQRFARSKDATRGGIYTVVAGLILVFIGFPIVKFLVGRDVFLERLVWLSPKGLAIQAAILAALCALFFALTAGLRRVLDRLPDAMTGPIVTPVAVAVLSASLLGWGAFHPPATTPIRPGNPSGPNIVLVMVDTLRADATDPYGGPGLTPALGKFASRSVTFDRAYAHSSWTRPSVATVLSGRYPSSHGAMFKMDGLPDGVDTIAEALSASGYVSQGIVSNYVTAPYFNFGQGFHEYRYLEPRYMLGASEVTSKFNLYELLRSVDSKLRPDAVPPNGQYRDGSQVTASALRWVDGWSRSAKADERYFLFVQYMDPHDPYFAHPYDGTVVSRKAMPNPPPSMKDRIRKLYDGEVSFWDRQFGLLVDGLENTPGWKDTLVVVFADHGEEFMEHGGWWHGDTLYEEAVRVPLVVRLPGDEAAGRHVADPVGLVDIAPTLGRLGGAKLPDSWQGQDLFEAGDSPIFFEEIHTGNELKAVLYKKADGSLWKVVTANQGNPRGLPQASLFALAKDPDEKKNLAATSQPELTLALESLAKAAGEAASNALAGKTIEIDDKSLQHLKDLGYVHGPTK